MRDRYRKFGNDLQEKRSKDMRACRLHGILEVEGHREFR
jgi:hypothetical protein